MGVVEDLDIREGIAILLVIFIVLEVLDDETESAVEAAELRRVLDDNSDDLGSTRRLADAARVEPDELDESEAVCAGVDLMVCSEVVRAWARIGVAEVLPPSSPITDCRR